MPCSSVPPAAAGTLSSAPDKQPARLSRLTVIVVLAVLVALPAQILFEHFSRESGFLRLIDFGHQFRKTALPEVRELASASPSRSGYDGQFYAQLALRPALADPALEHALDNPRYRARRIGLPLLAHSLGLGQPGWVLQIYALLNACFWVAMLAALLRFTGCQRLPDLLLAFALLGSSGTLISVTKALTDFPATVLGALAIVSNRRWAARAALLSVSALVKETSVLSFAAAQWGRSAPGADLRRSMICALILFLPVGLWLAYVYLRLDTGFVTGHRNFALPLVGVAHKLWSGWQRLASASADATIFGYAFLLFEILCPMSLLVQAIYLAVKPNPASEAWKFGIGFAILLCFLSDLAWVGQAAYMRILLPLTFSFNLLIHRHESGPRFAVWYLLGNCGLYSALFFSLL
jgi:hypothetical protein